MKAKVGSFHSVGFSAQIEPTAMFVDIMSPDMGIGLYRIPHNYKDFR
jgi:hypothetical protein